LSGLFPSISFGIELSGGLSAAEEGDDRYRPALEIGLSPTPAWDFRGFYYGRSFGPITESTGIVAANKRFNPFNSTMLAAEIGLAILNESTAVVYKAPEDSPMNISESRWNVGVFTGLYLTFFSAGPLFANASWESAIVPAGVSGGIFLANGRKQFFGAQLGVRL
jgi:hypothetical protein